MTHQVTSTKPEALTIKITEDGLKAFMTINSNNCHQLSLDLNSILQRLNKQGIKFGIKDLVIKTILQDKIYNRSILVAEGIPPQAGKDASIEYKFNKKDKPGLLEDIEGKVDFRELRLIDIVHTNDVLASKILPTQGTPGKKVTGEQIPVKKGEDINIPVGENTCLSHDKLTLFSSADGYVFWEDSRIGVKTTYEILSDVDMNVGNINFIGPVKVKGDVKEGFFVKAKGDVEIGGVVENATVISEGNITVMQGIIGSKSKIVCDGDLKCKFIQNANIEVKGNIIVHDAILHSDVHAGKGVFVLGGKKGAIIGGRISAKEEVNAKNIGSISEVTTEIEVGVDPQIRQEIDALEESLTTEKTQLHQERLNYKTLLAQNKTELAEQSLSKQKELEEVIKMMHHHLYEFKKHVRANYKGKVSAFDTLWPGVKLTIGNATVPLKIDYRYVTFYNSVGHIEQTGYEKPKIKVETPTITYWEREIDKVK
ncbi:MAG: FapA family protein [bacterium]